MFAWQQSNDVKCGLQWERSWLEAQLAAEFGKEQREALFLQWGIAPSSARRKRQLVERFWSPKEFK